MWTFPLQQIMALFATVDLVICDRYLFHLSLRLCKVLCVGSNDSVQDH